MPGARSHSKASYDFARNQVVHVMKRGPVERVEFYAPVLCDQAKVIAKAASTCRRAGIAPATVAINFFCVSGS